jgi:broad specificity phosphatase PhoE
MSSASTTTSTTSTTVAITDDVQIFWVIRHGDRLDNHDSTWHTTTKTPEDTPLSAIGHQQAQDVAKFILSSDEKVSHILASPFLRTIETAVPLSKASNVPIKLEASVWETGCRNPPPSHHDKDFPLHKEGYESCFIPECGEHPSEFRPRLARSAAGLLQRFPHGSGNVAIFSHADPVAYLVTELCAMDPTLTGPVAPTSLFRLERRKGETHFRLILNSSIAHLSRLGKTEPCHPIHFFHDWCQLFEDMRNQKVADPSFRWPPKSHEMDVFKQHWHERYTRLLVQGKTDKFPVVKPRPTPEKVKFKCPKCDVVSFIPEQLMKEAPRGHSLSCWSCKQSYLLSSIVLWRPAPDTAKLTK